MSNYEELFTGTMNEILDTGERPDLFQGLVSYMHQEGLTELVVKDYPEVLDQKIRVSCNDGENSIKIEIVSDET